VGQHGVRFEGGGAAERLDRGRQIVPVEGPFAVLNQLFVAAFAFQADHHQDGGGDDQDGEGGEKVAAHGTSPAIAGLTSITVSYERTSPMAEGVGVKPIPAISWAETSDREAALIAQCVGGDEAACADLVAAHQRMVYQLALHLLADHNEALDLSQ